MDVVTLGMAATAAKRGYLPAKPLATPAPFAASRIIPKTSTSMLKPVGQHVASGTMWWYQSGAAGPLQSGVDGTTSGSAFRSVPAGMTSFSAVVARLGTNDYILGLVAGVVTLYRTPSVAANTGWGAWSSALVSCTAGSGLFGTFNLIASEWGSGDVLVVSEYGDPTGGPSIRVSSDGTTWATTFGPDPTIRHIHAVNWDPYVPGTLYAAVGDNNVRTILRSTDYGQTWTTIVADNRFQGTQISFTATHLWLAGDTMNATVIRMNKATLALDVPSLNHHKDICPPAIGVSARRVTDLVTTATSATVTSATAAFTSADVGAAVISPNLPPRTYVVTYTNATTVTVSAAAFTSATATATIGGDSYYRNALFGCVDPATGIYYCVAVDGSAGGNMFGVFYLPRAGDQLRILDPGGVALFNLPPGCMIAGTNLYVGDRKYALLSFGLA